MEMDSAIVRQFLDFFQDFLNLCQSKSWPNNSTSEQEIKKAFLIAIHIEKCLEKLQKKNIINEFLSTLNSSQDTSRLFLKNCLDDPPKYILKKLVTSHCKITQVDLGIKVFLALFSDEKLEDYLAQIMLEAASKETLLRNLSTEVPKTKLVKFKSQLLLSELNTQEDTKASVLQLLNNCTLDTVELLVVSLLNKDYDYPNAIRSISNALKQFMLGRDPSAKKFWKLLFRLDEKLLTELGLEFSEIFKMMARALLDCGKLISEEMSAEYFYIDLSFSELGLAVQKICANENLKLEFFDIVRESGSDMGFWESMVS